MALNSLKKQQDNPFLTLSQRNQAGLSSQNIHGEEKTKEAQQSKEVDSDSIFARQAQGGFRNQQMFAQEGEQSAEQYIQENENGEMGFDMSGFYNDAVGVNISSSDKSAGASNPIEGSKDSSHQLKHLKEKLKTLIQEDAPDREKEEIKAKLMSYGLSEDDVKKVEEEGQKEKVNTEDNDTKKMSDTKENAVAISAPQVEKTSGQTFGNIGTDMLNMSGNTSSQGLFGAELKQLNSTLTKCKVDIASAKRELDASAVKYSKAKDEHERKAINNDINKLKKQIEEHQKKQKEAQERKEELMKELGQSNLVDKSNKTSANKANSTFFRK